MYYLDSEGVVYVKQANENVEPEQQTGQPEEDVSSVSASCGCSCSQGGPTYVKNYDTDIYPIEVVETTNGYSVYSTIFFILEILFVVILILLFIWLLSKNGGNNQKKNNNSYV